MTQLNATEEAVKKHLEDHPNAVVAEPPAPPKDPTEEPAPKHELRIMGKSGDDKLTWDSDDEKQVLRARTTFQEYMSKGYKMYKTSTIGGKKTGDPITEFDPNIERMIAVPPMQGG